jgi:hypothetical protein
MGNLSYGDMLLLLSVFSLIVTGIAMKAFHWAYDRSISREVQRDIEQEYNSWSR